MSDNKTVRNIRVVVHIGSTAVYTIVSCSSTKPNKVIDILAVGEAHTKGFVAGQVTNNDHLFQAIQDSINKAKDIAAIDFFWVDVALAMPSMVSKNIRIDMNFLHNGHSTATGHLITQEDIAEAFEKKKFELEKEGLFPMQLYTQATVLDNDRLVEKAVGMHANHLFMNVHAIGFPNGIYRQISQLFKRCNLDVRSWFFDGITGAQYALTQDEKDRGVLFMDIGMDTTNICLYKEKKLLFSRCLPFGGQMIDEAIAHAFELSIKEAQILKKQHGSAYPSNKSRSDFITLMREDGSELTIGIYKLATIIEEKCHKLFRGIFDVIRSEDESLLGFFERAGIVLAGEGSDVEGLTKWIEQNIQVGVRNIGVNDQIDICAEYLTDDNIKLLQNYLNRNELYSALGLLLYQDDGLVTTQNQTQSTNGQALKSAYSWLLHTLRRWA